MIVYRLAPEPFVRDLSGEGAYRFGYRFNSKGKRILYASSSRALSILEVLVHINARALPHSYAIASIEIPDNYLVNEQPESSLPKDWKTFPYSKKTQAIGDTFLDNDANSILKIPSVIVPEEWNILINPTHVKKGGVKMVKVTPFSFDARLFEEGNG